MCYAIPGKVEAVHGKTVTVDYFGRKKRAINELSALQPGDYVFAQGGYVIQKVAPREAEEILAAWKEMFDDLQDLDQALAQPAPAAPDVRPAVSGLIARAGRGDPLTDEEAVELLSLSRESERQLFYQAANALRRRHHENACCVHGIVEISNYCGRTCAYCGIGAGNGALSRYRMSRDEILEAVGQAVEGHGFKALVLQSGEDPGYDIGELAEIIREIKRRHAVLLLISFGEIGEDGLRRLFEAGARGLLMRFETSNPALYRQLHPGSTLDTRLAHIRQAYAMGYMIITGGLIGLPGQTPLDVVGDIRLAGRLHPEMLSFGPFLPHPGTSLAGNPPPAQAEVLKALALARCLSEPDMKVLVTTAFETLTPAARRDGLLAGASSLMIQATPLRFRPLYSIYPGRAHAEETLASQVTGVVELLKSLGRGPADMGIGRAGVRGA